jgi:hypothetical protein
VLKSIYVRHQSRAGGLASPLEESNIKGEETTVVIVRLRSRKLKRRLTRSNFIKFLWCAGHGGELDL